jgi:SAM-dependent methyltransferase
MSYKDQLITLLSYLRQPKKRKLIKLAYSFRGRSGIEIGGPSVLFGLRGGLPVYVFAEKIDGVNFSTNTVWEGEIREGLNYHYFGNKTGHQYIAEATELSKVASDKYEFLLSCHSLEHVANPLKAIMEWKRVLKKNGTFVLVLPDKMHTFDINRPYTDFNHLLQDYQDDTNEHDQTHFDEIIRFHDHTKDPGLKSKEEVATSLKSNFEHRLAHHHVFSQELVRKMLEYCGFRIKSQTEIEPFHLITIAEKEA